MANGSITLRSVASADNIADICTKPLGKVKFSLLRSMLGVVHLDSDSDVDVRASGCLSDAGC